MLAAALYGEARRLAVEAGSIAEAKQILSDLAAGRYDLRSQEAGLAAGYWTATAHRADPVELLTAGLLAVSGPVDFNTLANWVKVGRHRGSAPVYRAE